MFVVNSLNQITMKKTVLTLAVVAATYCANAQTEKKAEDQAQPVKSEQATTPQKEVKKDAPATIQAAPANHESAPADKEVKKDAPQKDSHKATEMEKPKDKPKE